MAKKKSPIAIKPSHEGRFTEWAKRHGFPGVTDAAIAMGERSKNPHIRAEAQFADNARKFHH